VATQGVCPESEWPYTEPFSQQPSSQSYTDALSLRATQYLSLTQSLNQLKGCLAAGKPFVFGFTVYTYFETAAMKTTGILQMPNLSDPEEHVVGGHAVMAVGYDDANQSMIVRNSWGDQWGLAGYFMMPYTYIMDSSLARDFWTVEADSTTAVGN